MTVRLIILVVVAGFLAVAFAMKSSAPPIEPSEADFGEELVALKDGTTIEQVREMQLPLGDRFLPGEEPDVPPEFDVRVSVERTGRKFRLFLDISERHGYYVETFRVIAWYKPTPDTTEHESPIVIEDFKEVYLPANDTVRVCLDAVPSEVGKIPDGDLGTDANWGADVIFYGRARTQNPQPLPLLADAFDCR
jgi:hypothetical protein